MVPRLNLSVSRVPRLAYVSLVCKGNLHPFRPKWQLSANLRILPSIKRKHMRVARRMPQKTPTGTANIHKQGKRHLLQGLLFSCPVENQVDDLFPNGVVATCEIICLGEHAPCSTQCTFLLTFAIEE